MPLSNDLANLIAFACEATLYGANAILFLVSIVIITQRRHQANNLTHPVVLLNCLIFLCCTTHFAIEFNHFYTTLGETGVDGFADETKPLLGADTLMSVTDFLGDMVLIYRCWMLYAQTPIVVVLPFLTALGGLACIAGVAHFVISVTPTSPAAPAAIVPLGLAGYSLPLCTNVLVTALIVYRIWYTSSTLPNTAQFIAQGASRRAMMLVIESGMLYLLAQLIYVVLFALEHPAQAIAGLMAVQIYGIAPTLIIIRVGLGISSEHSNTMASTHIKWVARRGDASGTTGTRFTDVLGAETDMEDGSHMKDFMFKAETGLPTVDEMKDTQDMRFAPSESPESQHRNYSPA